MIPEDLYDLFECYAALVAKFNVSCERYSKGNHNRARLFVRQRIKLLKEIYAALIDLQKQINKKKIIDNLEYVAQVKADTERLAHEHEEQAQREEQERLQREENEQREKEERERLEREEKERKEKEERERLEREDLAYDKEKHAKLWDEPAAQQKKEAEQRADKKEKFVKSEKERTEKLKSKMNKSINALKTSEEAQENSTVLKSEGNKKNQENSTDGTETKVEQKPKSEVNPEKLEKIKNKNADNDESKDGEKHEIDPEQDKKPKDSNKSSFTGENLEKNDGIGAKGTKKHKKKDDNDEENSGNATSEKQKGQDNNNESTENVIPKPEVKEKSKEKTSPVLNELGETISTEQKADPESKKGEDSTTKEQTHNEKEKSEIKSEDSTKSKNTSSDEPQDQDNTNESAEKAADSQKIEKESQKTPSAEQSPHQSTENNKKDEDSTTKEQTHKEEVEIKPEESNKPKAAPSEKPKAQDSTNESDKKVADSPKIKKESKETPPTEQNSAQSTEDSKGDEEKSAKQKTEAEQSESEKASQAEQNSTQSTGDSKGGSAKQENETSQKKFGETLPTEQSKSEKVPAAEQNSAPNTENNKKNEDSTQEKQTHKDESEIKSEDSDKSKVGSSEETKDQVSTNETNKESNGSPKIETESKETLSAEQNSAKNAGDNKEGEKPNSEENEQKPPPVEANQHKENLDDKKTDTHGEEESSVSPEKKESSKDDKSQKNEEPSKPSADDVNNDNDAPPQGEAQTSIGAPTGGEESASPEPQAQITSEQQKYISDLAEVYTQFIQGSSKLGGDLNEIRKFIQARHQNTKMASQVNVLQPGYKSNANLSVRTNENLAQFGTVEKVFENIIFVCQEKILNPITATFKQGKETDGGKNTRDFKKFVTDYADLLHYMQSMNTDGLGVYYQKGDVFAAALSCLCSIYYTLKVSVPKKDEAFNQFVQKIPTEESTRPNLGVSVYIAKVGELFEEASKALPKNEGTLEAANKYIETASNPQFSLNKKFKELEDDYVVYSRAEVSQIVVLKDFKTVEDTFVGMLELFNERVLNPILRAFIGVGNALSAEVNKCKNKICTDTSKGNAFQGFIRDNAPILQRVIGLLQIQDDLDGAKGKNLFLNVWCNLCAQFYKSPSIKSMQLLKSAQLEPNEIHDLTSLAYAQFGAKPQEGEEPKDVEPHLVSLDIQNPQTNELEPQSFYVTSDTKVPNLMDHFSQIFGGNDKWAIVVKFKIDLKAIEKIKKNASPFVLFLMNLLGGLEGLIVFAVETACTNGNFKIEPKIDKKKLFGTEYTLTIRGNININILKQPQTIFKKSKNPLSKEGQLRKQIDSAIAEKNKKLAAMKEKPIDLNLLEQPATRLAFLPNLQALIGEYGELIGIEFVKL